ncbi:MAG: PqqD family protein [Firmicutes bacterium]|nr:PqqD family protein [Bacillota bacterium]
MKIKDGFMLREIAGSWMVVPIGERVVEFNGLMVLSESGAVLWNKLVKGDDIEGLAMTLSEEYDIDQTTARTDVESFVSMVAERGLFEE